MKINVTKDIFTFSFHFKVVASDNATTSDNIFILKKNSEDEPIPTVLNPIQQVTFAIRFLWIMSRF